MEQMCVHKVGGQIILKHIAKCNEEFWDILKASLNSLKLATTILCSAVVQNINVDQNTNKANKKLVKIYLKKLLKNVLEKNKLPTQHISQGQRC